jgi:uncharacterized protein with PIN domain
MAEDKEEARREAAFLKRAKELYERMMHRDQEQMVTFTQIEDRALEVGRELETLLVNERLARVAERQGIPGCPRCRRPVEVRSASEERALQARTGEVRFKRPQCYCPSCRKSFFPAGR